MERGNVSVGSAIDMTFNLQFLCITVDAWAHRYQQLYLLASASGAQLLGWESESKEWVSLRRSARMNITPICQALQAVWLRQCRLYK
jgi:hypothetical protein